MALYATMAEMIARFGEHDLMLLTERANSTPGQINTPVLDQAIADASAEIDGFLAGRYTLPLTTVPPILERICCDIARFYLGSDNAPEVIEKRYDIAIAYLKDVGTGKLSLGVNDTGEKAESSITAVMESAGSVFARDKSKGFI